MTVVFFKDITFPVFTDPEDDYAHNAHESSVLTAYFKNNKRSDIPVWVSICSTSQKVIQVQNRYSVRPIRFCCGASHRRHPVELLHLHQTGSRKRANTFSLAASVWIKFLHIGLRPLGSTDLDKHRTSCTTAQSWASPFLCNESLFMLDCLFLSRHSAVLMLRLESIMVWPLNPWISRQDHRWRWSTLIFDAGLCMESFYVCFWPVVI